MLYLHTGIESGQLAGNQPNIGRSAPQNELNPDPQIQGLLCFSHLRWDFVYQRPQHLMTRASVHWPIYFWEEPIDDEHEELRIWQVDKQLVVLQPHISFRRSVEQREAIQRQWLKEWVLKMNLTSYIVWYYTPMTLTFTDPLGPSLTIYDCMDELSAFHGAPPALEVMEKLLMQRTDLMFTGGYSLYEHKRGLHPSIHLFPSAIDFGFFSSARLPLKNPVDQASIPGPRIGFSGVIDERFDCTLVQQLADRRPEWQFIFLGPIVKINPATLPRRDNIHFLGMKQYSDLPAYFSHWQVALLPFALNRATRFISPTKTPEYLAAGLPVVSTPIHDVVHDYDRWDSVFIEKDATGFEKAIEQILCQPTNRGRDDIDQWLKDHSWDKAWQQMQLLIYRHLINQVSIGK